MAFLICSSLLLQHIQQTELRHLKHLLQSDTFKKCLRESSPVRVYMFVSLWKVWRGCGCAWLLPGTGEAQLSVCFYHVKKRLIHPWLYMT